MKIAQVAPLVEAVPPKLYGGTERVVSYITEELVELGHDVTLFASGDSVTSATLEAVWPKALRLDPEVSDNIAPVFMMLEKIARRAEEFDVVHLHLDYYSYPLLRHLKVPAITTLHGPLGLKELQALYHYYSDIPVVSISNSQREPLPYANYVGTVYHGLPEHSLQMGEGKGGYLAFLGRISPEKAPDHAIRMAREAGMPLKIAAKIDTVDEEYWDEKIKPLVDDPNIEFIGEISEAQKSEFLGNAAALLFPTQWKEPFGLVMIEAMACGTPVIAYPQGSVGEVLEDGLTGFFVTDEHEGARAIERLGELDRKRIRGEFERRFTARRMAQDYVKLYETLVRNGSTCEAVAS